MKRPAFCADVSRFSASYAKLWLRVLIGRSRTQQEGGCSN